MDQVRQGAEQVCLREPSLVRKSAEPATWCRSCALRPASVRRPSAARAHQEDGRRAGRAAVRPAAGRRAAAHQCQIVKRVSAASLGAMSVGNNAKEPQTPPESGDTASADADEVHRAVPDALDATVAHDRDNNRAVAQDTSRADAQSAVDPWALPEAGAGDAWSPTDDASHNVSRDVSRNAPQDEAITRNTSPCRI